MTVHWLLFKCVWCSEWMKDKVGMDIKLVILQKNIKKGKPVNLFVSLTFSTFFLPPLSELSQLSSDVI